MNKEEIQKLKDILWANTWDDEQIIEEGIATLKNAFDLQDEGFRRIESAGLLAIYTLQHQLEEKNKIINETIDYIEEHGGYISHFTHLKIEYAQNELATDEVDNLLEILERGKNGK